MAANNEVQCFEEILDNIMRLDIENVDKLPPQDDNLEEVEGDDDGGDFDEDDGDDDEGFGAELLPLATNITKEIAAGTPRENEERTYCALGSYVLVNTTDGMSLLCLECYYYYRYKILPTWKHAHAHRHRSGFMSELPLGTKCAGCKNNLFILQLQETCYYCISNKLI